MTTTQIIIIVAVIAVIVLLVAGRGGGGPRVTQIDRTIRKEKDEPEDRGDA